MPDFWPKLSLVVLIEVVLIKKKGCRSNLGGIFFMAISLIMTSENSVSGKP